MAIRTTGPREARNYGDMRDFSRTPEPGPGSAAKKSGAGAAAPVFVVQKHAASRLHWDFRLEHDGALWSWAVPKGPSLDPHHKRLAMHVEDHPVEYATFAGVIPEGNYGAGTVEIWDRGTWEPVEADAAAALAKGELKFRLNGERLQGGFVLVRLKPRPHEKSESWLLIKEHDSHEREGADAGFLETAKPGATGAADKPATSKKKPARRKASSGGAPLPETQAPQLAQLARNPPTGEGWVSEVKFDGYRMLVRKDGANVRIITRNGLDWTDRLPALAEAVAAMAPDRLMLDGELVALDSKGLSSFARLQDAFSTRKTGSTRNTGSTRKTGALLYYTFDLLHLDGVDFRPKPLSERREVLETLMQDAPETGPLRYSEHLASDAARVRKEACAIGLEGIICKRLDAPYRAGRGGDWIKVKCENREEFVVLGYTPPAGTREGLGALQLGYYDEDGQLYFLGGCGTGFTDKILRTLTDRLEKLKIDGHDSLLGTEKPPRDTIWVRPELVAEIVFAGFTGGGMVRQASFLGLREDKSAEEVIRPVLPSETARIEFGQDGTKKTRSGQSQIVVARRSERGARSTRSSDAAETGEARPDAGKTKPDNGTNSAAGRGTGSGPAGREPADSEPKAAASHGKRSAADKAVPSHVPEESETPPARSSIVVAKRTERDAIAVDGQRISHADRPLWAADANGPALTKRDLAFYWQAVAPFAAPGIVGRPLAFVRCPDGVGGEQFFQKHLGRGMPDALHEAQADGAPYVAMAKPDGLIAAAQIAAIELHSWGSSEADPLHADRLVFDLDPGDGVTVPVIVQAAKEIKARLEAIGLAAFCRTSGGKGLHVVAPLRTKADWDTVRAWCRSFAEALEAEAPDRFVSTTRKTDRTGKILIDWLRNGLGSTAIASFSPRARPGAGVATPLAWREVTPKLDLAAFNLRTVPARLSRQKADPWEGFADAARDLPGFKTKRSRKE